MAKKDITFEQALAELEETIATLEGDELTLDTALANFEKGIGLMRACEGHLKSAEGKLKELLKGKDGEFIEKILGSTASAIISGDDNS
jgi:exodeoxyribonuclease VII small subunit